MNKYSPSRNQTVQLLFTLRYVFQVKLVTSNGIRTNYFICHRDIVCARAYCTIDSVICKCVYDAIRRSSYEFLARREDLVRIYKYATPLSITLVHVIDVTIILLWRTFYIAFAFVIGTPWRVWSINFLNTSHSRYGRTIDKSRRRHFFYFNTILV